VTGATSIVPLFLAAGGGVLYHVAAKSIPRELSPGLVLIVAYATALAMSVGAWAWMPAAPGGTMSRLAHPAVLGLGVGAAMIELGYVLTYRTGWPVSVVSVMINGVVAAVLVPVGLLLFSERPSLTRFAGMALCLAGVWLLRH
jgi:drug/metabolite transporter (DMT)-like permease